MNLIGILFRDIKGNKRFVILFVVNLVLGIVGLLLVNSFRETVLHSVRSSSKEFLAADLAVYSRHKLPQKELLTAESLLPPGFEYSNMVEMYTMSSTDKMSRLSLLTFVDEQFPFYGELELGSGRKISHGSLKEILTEDSVWVYPELLTQLNLKVGDKIQIGQSEFKIADTVVKSTGQSASFSALAPMIYLGREKLPQTELLQKGSTTWRSRLYKLPEDKNIKAEDLEEKIDEKLTDPTVRVVSHVTSSEQSSRLLLYLNDYLGLAGLVALFLAAIGAIYLSKSYFWQQLRNMAIYKSLGLPSSKLITLYVLQMLLVSWLALVPALVLSALMLPMAKEFLSDLSLFDLEISLSLQTVLMAFLILSAITFTVILPFLIGVARTPANFLFREGGMQDSKTQQVSNIYYLPLLVLFWGLGVWQSHSFKLGSLFLLALLVAVFVMAGFYRLMQFALQKWSRRQKFLLQQALLGILRRPLTSLAIFVSVGLCAFLLSFIVNVEKGIQEELSFSEGEGRPSLFLFDIQEDQVEPLKKILAQENIAVQQLSPMIRSKLLEVNGKSFEKLKEDKLFSSREREREKRFRNRGMNLSYRDELLKSEKIIKGSPILENFKINSTDLPEISLETRFADRLGLNLGDKLLFDVQGVEVLGEVVNLRRIKWTSFQPNFFIQFQPGVLNDAPKTFLATLPDLDEEQKMAVQTKIVKELANISMVDVSRLMERIFGIFVKMSTALKFIALMTLVAGLSVVFAITRSLIAQKSRDSMLYKVLGVEVRKVINIQLLEVLILSLSGTLLGTAISLFLVYLSSNYLFNGDFVVDPLWTPVIIVANTTLACATVYLISKNLLGKRSKVELN